MRATHLSWPYLPLVLAIALVMSGVPAQAVSVVADSEREYGGHSYCLLTASNWPDAEAFAEALGGHLVVMDDAAENEWIGETYAPGHTRFLWIGLFQDPDGEEPAGGWQWVDGTPVTYTRWDAGEPNNAGGNEEYTHLFWRDGVGPVWNDAPLSYWGTCYGVVEYGIHFDDIPEDHWAYDEITACSSADIVNGYADGLYHPADEVRRSQMAVFIARALAEGDANVPDPDPGTQTFPDVASSGYGEDGALPYWAYKYIESCSANGVADGYSDGSYHPEEAVNRAQMAVYLARALVASSGEAALADYEPLRPRNFSDVPAAFWAYRHVEYCWAHSVVMGYDDELYHPELSVTRDQMAVYIARAFELIE